MSFIPTDRLFTLQLCIMAKRSHVSTFLTFLRDRLYRSVVCQCVLSCAVLSVCDVGVLWPNGWTDQHETWHTGMPRPWPHCVRWGPSSPSPKGGDSASPIFGPYLLRPNGCGDQDANRYGGRPRPSRHCVRLDGTPLPLLKKGAEPHTPNFWPTFIVAKRLDGSRWHLACRWALVHATLC